MPNNSGKHSKSSNETRPWDVFKNLHKKQPQRAFTHVSLFSGCGGFDLGFTQAGFETVFSNDVDVDACDTFQKNLGKITSEDIRTVDLPRFRKRVDVLTAGFPCQPFSNAGNRRGVKDDRGTLYEAAINAVQHYNPRVVLFENVRGLLSFKKGKQLLVGKICQTLEGLNYEVSFSLIDASKHHVPQRRLRLFIVGVSKRGKLGQFSFPRPECRDDLTLKHTILDIPNGAANQTELMKLNPQALEIGEMVPEGGSWKNIPYKLLPDRLKRISDNMEKYRWPNFYRRFHRDEIAGTITAAFKPENAGVWHPTKQRIMSVREIARIQSFPDWFTFHGRTVKSKYKQIGNAVPPRLAYELAIQITKVLSGNNKRDLTNVMFFDQFINAGKPLKACDKEVLYKEEAKLF